MWADVQKVLHRYVDEVPLFQRLEAKLKNSGELMMSMAIVIPLKANSSAGEKEISSSVMVLSMRLRGILISLKPK
jgi:hypothetical protein